MKRIILSRAINCLGNLGNKDSIPNIEKLIDDSNPLGEVSREAMFNCIILSNYELQRIENYINICVDKNQKFWLRSLLNTFLRNYDNESKIDLKNNLENVIKQTIKLLEKHNYSYWVEEILDKKGLGDKFDVVSKGGKDRKKKKNGAEKVLNPTVEQKTEPKQKKKKTSTVKELKENSK